MESSKNKYIVQPTKDNSVDNSTFVKTDDNDEPERLSRKSADPSTAQGNDVSKLTIRNIG